MVMRRDLVALLALILLGGTVCAAPLVLTVSPTGNDAWSGKLAAPNAAKTDGPLASLAGARDAIRKLKAAGPLTQPVEVRMRGGVCMGLAGPMTQAARARPAEIATSFRFRKRL